MLLIAILLGLLMGSFANMLVYRIPLDKDIIFLRSHCTNCKHKLGANDLLPVFSYLWNRGKCRYCNIRIGRRYLIIELLAMLYSVFLYNKHGISERYYLEMIIAIALISISFIDLEKMIVPDCLVVTIAIMSIIGVLLDSYFLIDLYLLRNSLKGFLFTLLIWSAIYFLSKKSVGHGDIKLFLAISIALGFVGSINVFLISHFIASIVSIVLLATKKKCRKSLIPFAPFISLSYFAVAVVGISVI